MGVDVVACPNCRALCFVQDIEAHLAWHAAVAELLRRALSDDNT